jgi:hypothetical protein
MMEPSNCFFSSSIAVIDALSSSVNSQINRRGVRYQQTDWRGVKVFAPVTWSSAVTAHAQLAEVKKMSLRMRQVALTRSSSTCRNESPEMQAA